MFIWRTYHVTVGPRRLLSSHTLFQRWKNMHTYLYLTLRQNNNYKKIIESIYHTSKINKLTEKLINRYINITSWLTELCSEWYACINIIWKSFSPYFIRITWSHGVPFPLNRKKVTHSWKKINWSNWITLAFTLNEDRKFKIASY